MLYGWFVQGGWTVVLTGMNLLLVILSFVWMGLVNSRVMRVEFRHHALAERIVWTTKKMDDITRRTTGEFPPISLTDEERAGKTRVKKKA